MSKVEVGKVAEILKKNEIDPAVLRRVLEELNLEAQPEGGEEEKPPALKKQFSIVISDPEGKIPAGSDFAGWVLQIPENESPASIEERIFRAAYDFNTTKKGRMYPVATVGEALEGVPAKHFKAADLWVKTKNPVLVIRTDNMIPKENSSQDGRWHKAD